MAESKATKNLIRHRLIIAAILVVLVGSGLILSSFLTIGRKQHSRSSQTFVNKNAARRVSSQAEQNLKNADSLALTGNPSAAAAALNSAAAGTTNITDKTSYYTEASTILLNSGQNDAAVQAEQAAITADPTNWQLYANLGYVYESIGDTSSAISAYQEALKLVKANPPDPSTTENGGPVEIQGELQKLGVAS